MTLIKTFTEFILSRRSYIKIIILFLLLSFFRSSPARGKEIYEIFLSYTMYMNVTERKKWLDVTMWVRGSCYFHPYCLPIFSLRKKLTSCINDHYIKTHIKRDTPRIFNHFFSFVYFNVSSICPILFLMTIVLELFQMVVATILFVFRLLYSNDIFSHPNSLLS
jgi:hypothetical protein